MARSPVGWVQLRWQAATSIGNVGSRCLLFLLLLLLVLVPGQLAAQRRAEGALVGQVVDAESREPIEGALVTLEGLERSAISNTLGRFAISSVRLGLVTVRIERLGYATSTGEVDIGGGEITETVVYLATEAIAVDPIVVTSRRRAVSLPPVHGLDHRYFSGWGRFVLKEEIEKRNPVKLTDVLTETGLEITGNGASVKLRRANCAPVVYIDGTKVTRSLLGSGREAEGRSIYPWPDPEADPGQQAAYNLNLVHPSNVLAVEVYRSVLETPAEFLTLNNMCGTVLIWTHRGAGMAEQPRPATGKASSLWRRAFWALGLAAAAGLAHSIF